MRTTRPAHSLCSVFLRARVAQVLCQAGARRGPGCKIRAGYSERVVMSAQARTHARTTTQTNPQLFYAAWPYSRFSGGGAARGGRGRGPPRAGQVQPHQAQVHAPDAHPGRGQQSAGKTNAPVASAAGRTHNDGSALPSCLEVLQGVGKTGKKNLPVLTPRRSTV